LVLIDAINDSPHLFLLQYEEIRKETEKRIADLDKAVNDRIDARRRERMEQLTKEIAEARKAAISEADKTIAGWEAKYRERCEAIIKRIAGTLTGKAEG
jgi:hypothetical protein